MNIRKASARGATGAAFVQTCTTGKTMFERGDIVRPCNDYGELALVARIDGNRIEVFEGDLESLSVGLVSDYQRPLLYDEQDQERAHNLKRLWELRAFR